MGQKSFQYITIAEPQGESHRNTWHLHILLIFDDEAPLKYYGYNYEKIVSGQSDILLVSHDEDDGMWEFLDGEDVCEENALVVSMSEMVQIDESINKLYDLPIGWIAYRDRTTGCI